MSTKVVDLPLVLFITLVKRLICHNLGLPLRVGFDCHVTSSASLSVCRPRK